MAAGVPLADGSCKARNTSGTFRGDIGDLHKLWLLLLTNNYGVYNVENIVQRTIIHCISVYRHYMLATCNQTYSDQATLPWIISFVGANFKNNILHLSPAVEYYLHPPFVTSKNNGQHTKLNLPSYWIIFSNSSPVCWLLKICWVILLIRAIGA